MYCKSIILKALEEQMIILTKNLIESYKIHRYMSEQIPKDLFKEKLEEAINLIDTYEYIRDCADKGLNFNKEEIEYIMNCIQKDISNQSKKEDWKIKILEKLKLNNLLL